MPFLRAPLTAANVNSCATNTWIATGNLIGNNDTGRYDTSQVQSGTQVSTYAAALTLLNSRQVVSSVSVDVDAGYAFADREQTTQLRKLTVNALNFPSVATPAAAKPNPSSSAARSSRRTRRRSKGGPARR